jgi:hypothetical protein
LLFMERERERKIIYFYTYFFRRPTFLSSSVSTHCQARSVKHGRISITNFADSQDSNPEALTEKECSWEHIFHVYFAEMSTKYRDLYHVWYKSDGCMLEKCVIFGNYRQNLSNLPKIRILIHGNASSKPEIERVMCS